MNANKIVFIDTEVDSAGKKIMDTGAIKESGAEFHSTSLLDFAEFLRDSTYVCGHNILRHDLKYLEKEIEHSGVKYFIDTLYLSPLMFPKKPYHRLVKDDKLTTDELNNPLNDATKARDLFYDEVAAFKDLNYQIQQIYLFLLSDHVEFRDFFRFNGGVKPALNTGAPIREFFAGKICENAPIEKMIEKYPVELAYALSLITVTERDSVTPPWVLRNYPRVENILHFLRNRRCPSCAYCNEYLDETRALKRFFGYDDFRNYDGEPLQQDAVKAAIDEKSILAVFPTGGGKSITFQLPALMAGENERGLTVVISPLQSLMKDQTDNLEQQHNITEAVTINGSLDPIERAVAFDRVENGSASLLYISPESLRSKSIELLLLKRNIARFVIDEAHCFSAWGQDFRVDYLYIGDFIDNLQKTKEIVLGIPVSCFTATAKRKVIADIKDYFKKKLKLDLVVFRASAERVNLRYHGFSEEDDDKKYSVLRDLITDNNCPTIVYVSRTWRAEVLAEKLTDDNYPARTYHGKMDSQTRSANQDAFMRGDVNIIVATTAFGMGVDKKDIGMVIHYNISDSLENYVQEAGRAGRDERIKADCYVLFNDEDLNSHFRLLNQSKLSQKEIRQVWRALKLLTKSRKSISRSPLEIARDAGWDDSVFDMETRIKTAISALERSGFIERGQNMPRVFADSILVKTMKAAREKIEESDRFDDTSRDQAIRIMTSLISAKNKVRGHQEEGEARIDYISDRLYIPKEDVLRVIWLLREEKILADAKDISAYIKKGEKPNRAKDILSRYGDIEAFLFTYLDNDEKIYNLKEVNEALQKEYPDTSIKQLNTIINYCVIKHLIKRVPENNNNFVTLKPNLPIAEIQSKSNKRRQLAGVIIDYLYPKAAELQGEDDPIVSFSILELKESFDHNLLNEKAEASDVEDALYYLQKIGAMKIDGGFLVIYNAMRLNRLEMDNRAQYKKEHYAQLEEYYQNKRQQIHIVGEYANRLIGDYYREAIKFVNDYFVMDYNMFLQKYFNERRDEICRNLTQKKHEQLFGGLSLTQRGIMMDQDSNRIVVAAGPGSGKTRLLTHKLASLYMMEDVKHEQMLMLTFSRAAATEFKKRLMTLIGNATNFIQITTFHSYCFDLLGKIGDIEKSDTIIEQTVEKIKAKEVDSTRLTKTVLVIDEAQDMSAAEYSLVTTLMEHNDDLRIIAVGDDDQNIYEFRESSSIHLESLSKMPDAKKYELVDNYRSNANIVEFANQIATQISHRLKHTPIMPMKKDIGKISICTLKSKNMAIPVANAIRDIKPSGSTCIVTRTNEEAQNIVGLLLKNGIAAKKIQTNDGFYLCDLAELRGFIVDVGGNDDSHAITNERWQQAKSNLKTKYANSKDLHSSLKLIGDFEETNNNIKYKSDFLQFISESNLEDAVLGKDGLILVSTIHQTKGREFDNVILAFSHFKKMDDETKRSIYVAITRAKQNLYIFCNGGYFDNISVENMQRSNDNNSYPPPDQISLQLSHKDVVLSYFASRKKELDYLMSGNELFVCEDGCLMGDRQVLKFSSKFCGEIEGLKKTGYSPTKATVRHIVFWKGKDMEDEIKIVLPDIEFSKIISSA